jgi:divalent metal cation (Fe/Co/Zn/Cd) transporter
VLFEDIAALVGLFAALGALLMSQVTGNGTWDGIGSIIVGVTLFGVAFFLARKTKQLLIGTSVTPAQRTRMVEIVEQSPGVKALVHMRSLHLGPEEVLVGMKVVVDDNVTARDVTQFIDLIEARLRAELPILKRIYIEIGGPEDPRVRMSGAVAVPDSPHDVDGDKF